MTVPCRVRRVVLLGMLAAVAGVSRGRAQSAARLTLDQAVLLALQHSPRLGAAREVMSQTAGGTREASAQRWPRLSLEGTVFRFDEPMIVAPLHAFEITRLPRFDETLIQSSVGLRYTVFDGGGRGARIGQAHALEQVAGSQARSVEQTIIAAVVGGFTEVLSAHEGLLAQETRVRAITAEADRVRRFLTEGRAARLDELRVEAALARARADSSQSALRLQVAESALARLIGAPPERVRADSLTSLRITAQSPPERTALVQEAIAANPTIRAAQSQLIAAEAGVRAARSEWFPTVRLEALAISYGAAEGDFSTEWQTGVRLSYPLFTGGARGGAIDRARAAAREAAANLRDAEEELTGEVDREVAQALDAKRRVEALGAALAHQREVARTEALALTEGAGVQSDYLRAEAELAAVRAELSLALSAEMVAHVALARLSGRLSREALATIVESVP